MHNFYSNLPQLIRHDLPTNLLKSDFHLYRTKKSYMKTYRLYCIVTKVLPLAVYRLTVLLQIALSKRIK